MALWGDTPDPDERPLNLKADEGPQARRAAFRGEGGWRIPLDGTDPEDAASELVAALSNPPPGDGIADDPPEFFFPQQNAVLAAVAGEPFKLVVRSTDIEDDSIELFDEASPAWATFVDNGNGTGAYTGTPPSATIETFQTRTQCSPGTFTTLNFQVVVSA